MEQQKNSLNFIYRDIIWKHLLTCLVFCCCLAERLPSLINIQRQEPCGLCVIISMISSLGEEGLWVASGRALALRNHFEILQCVKHIVGKKMLGSELHTTWGRRRKQVGIHTFLLQILTTSSTCVLNPHPECPRQEHFSFHPFYMSQAKSSVWDFMFRVTGSQHMAQYLQSTFAIAGAIQKLG